MKQVTINNGKISLTILDYGAVIQKLMVMDKNGDPCNVVVGLKEPEDYLQDDISLGASVGRFAGRISGGGFLIGSEKYPIYEKEGVHLHGGKVGFAKKYWEVEEVNEGESPYILLSYTSPHLEEGYPGELKARVRYMLDGNALKIRYEAFTDRSTVVNLTNHSYFMLDKDPDIGKHLLRLNCESVLDTDDQLLPTGKIIPADEAGLDFNTLREIGSTLMDTPFVCDPDNDFVGELTSNKSGIRMRVRSNQPAVVIYTPPDFPAICFETQNYPDAPNFEHFPSAVLHPGETYVNTAVFEFDLVI